MAYTTPPTFTVNQVLTAALMNGLGADIVDLDARTRPSFASIATSQTTTSVAYTDLATPGPAVTLTTGTLVMVTLSGQLNTGGAGISPFMSVAVSGATTLAAADAAAIRDDSSAVVNIQVSFSMLLSVTAGSNTFTCKYRVQGGTATFLNRTIIVVPANNIT